MSRWGTGSEGLAATRHLHRRGVWRRNLADGVARSASLFVEKVMADGPDFDEVFADLYRAARRLAWRLTGVEAVAEDVAAEALARALVRWSTVRRQPHPAAWVLRVTTNLALDELRRRSRRGEVTLAEGHQPSIAASDDALVLREALVAALSGLSRRQREAVVLVHLAGLTPKEAARSMRVSASSLSTHLQRGMAGLRRSLGDDPIPLSWEAGP